jgi:outer membrane protein assembly factor BamD (BamD/ComL family)
MPEVRTKLREAKDRLDASDYLVGYFYFRQRWYPGAIDRFKTLLKETGVLGRDAVYFHLAEALVKMKQELRPCRISRSFCRNSKRSEYLLETHKRIAELKAAAAQTK